MLTPFIKLAVPNTPPTQRILIGLWWITSLAGSVAGLIFYLAPLNLLTAVLWFIACLVIFVTVSPLSKIKTHQSKNQKQNFSISAIILFIATTVFIGATFYILRSLNIIDGIRSFWPNINPLVFSFFILSCALSSVITILFRERKTPLLLWMAFIFLMVGAAYLAFPLGYGFDGFIHRATETYIFQHGTITPKPLYYTGQYAPLVLLALLFRFPINLVDTILAPLLTAIFLPIASWIFLKDYKKSSFLKGLIILPLLSFVPFIATTPQGLADLSVLISGLFIAFLLRQKISASRFFLLVSPSVLWTFLIHPLAGIPLAALAFFSFVFLLTTKEKWQKILKKSLLTVGFLGGSIFLPGLFLLRTILAHEQIKLTSLNNVLLQFDNDLKPLFTGLLAFENPILHTQLLLSLLLPIILLSLAIYGFIKNRQNFSSYLAYPITLAIIAINYLLLIGVIDFSFLISYETRSYADRLLPIALYIAVPFILLGSAKLINYTSKQKLTLKISVIFIFLMLVVTNWYNTYPRDDAFLRTGGFNVSNTDLQVVKSIEKAGSKNYIVLTHQNTSVAALKELGFFHYYGDIFAYPIPTGGPLYQVFLQMTETPNTDTAKLAKKVIEDNCKKITCENSQIADVFFAIPKWWWKSEVIIETAKTTANEWWSTADEQAFIFRYRF